MAAKLIILFAKAPIAGEVKTRLLPAISADVAARLHSAFVADMIERFHSFEGADFQLHTDKRTDAWPQPVVTRKLQISGNLGLKMIHALGAGFEIGYQHILIVGSDAPTLPATHISALLSANSDVAFGPADDGGFYAVAARRIDPAMFDGVTWSNSDTLKKSVAAVSRCGLSVTLGPLWYDVDEPGDLDRLLIENELPAHTAKIAANLTAERRDTYRFSESVD